MASIFLNQILAKEAQSPKLGLIHICKQFTWFLEIHVCIFGVLPIHRADFIHGRPIRDGKGRCPVDSASMTTMMMMTTVHTLPASCPAQWRPFSVVDSKLQISLVGKLLFSLDRLWSLGLYVITSSGLAKFCFSHWYVTKQNIAGTLDGMT